jgi:hypothetical protein
MGLRHYLGILATFGALICASAAPAQAPCDEKCLVLIAGAYMDALTANDPAGSPVAANARTTENGVDTPLSQGIWKTATSWTYRHTFVDPVSGQIGAFGAVKEGETPAMLSLRLKVENRKVVESELLVARKGDFGLFEPAWSVEAKPVFKQVVPAERRATRAELEQIPTRYFSAIMQGKPSLIDVHPDAVRVENGFQTTMNPNRPTPSISEGLHRFIYMQKVRQLRTPIIDTTHGVVLAIAAVDMPKMDKTIMIRGKPHAITSERHTLPRTLFLFELFKVENGVLTSVEAVMRNAPLGGDMGWGGK